MLSRFKVCVAKRADVFEHSLSIDPKLALAHKELGDLLVASRDYDAAIEDYNEALRISPLYFRGRDAEFGGGESRLIWHERCSSNYNDMILISIQPFAARKMFALALAVICLSTASCFA